VRNSHGVSVAVTSYWTVAHTAFAVSGISEEAMMLSGHAGKFETPLLLAIQEDLVRNDLIPDGEPALPSHNSYAKGSAVFIAGKR